MTLLLLSSNPALARECNKKPGAGILPYSVTSEGKIKILLAYDTRGYWSNLAGGRKYILSGNHPKPRCETSQETAVREGWEESRHLLPKQFLASHVNSAATLPAQPKKGDFITYVFKMENIALEPFYDNYVVEGSSSDETNALFWADLSELRKFANDKKHKIITPNNKPLRPVFWKSFKKSLTDPEVNVFKK